MIHGVPELQYNELRALHDTTAVLTVFCCNLTMCSVTLTNGMIKEQKSKATKSVKQWSMQRYVPEYTMGQAIE